MAPESPDTEDRVEGPDGFLYLYDDTTLAVTLYHHNKKPGRPSKSLVIFAEGDDEIVYHLPRQDTYKALQMIGAME